MIRVMLFIAAASVMACITDPIERTVDRITEKKNGTNRTIFFDIPADSIPDTTTEYSFKKESH